MEIRSYNTVETTSMSLIHFHHNLLQPKPIEELNLSAFPFAFAREQTDAWQDYGHWSKFKITVMTYGECKPVVMGGATFDPLVIYEDHWVRSSDSHTSYFKLQGIDGQGKCFEKQFVCQGDEIGAHIIYSMTLIAAVGDVDESFELWKLMNGLLYTEISAGNLLSKAERIHTLAERIVKDKPYMRMFFQNGLERVVNVLKEKLNSLKWLK